MKFTLNPLFRLMRFSVASTVMALTATSMWSATGCSIEAPADDGSPDDNDEQPLDGSPDDNDEQPLGVAESEAMASCDMCSGLPTKVQNGGYRFPDNEDYVLKMNNGVAYTCGDLWFDYAAGQKAGVCQNDKNRMSCCLLANRPKPLYWNSLCDSNHKGSSPTCNICKSNKQPSNSSGVIVGQGGFNNGKPQTCEYVYWQGQCGHITQQYCNPLRANQSVQSVCGC